MQQLKEVKREVFEELMKDIPPEQQVLVRTCFECAKKNLKEEDMQQNGYMIHCFGKFKPQNCTGEC